MPSEKYVAFPFWLFFLFFVLFVKRDLFCGAATTATGNLTLDDERRLDDFDGGDDDEVKDTGSYVYSKMATLVPDPLLSEEQKEKYENEYGRWHFWDGDEDERPGQTDYCAEYKFRDIPGEFFPEDAWQQDAVFVNHLLNDGEKLVHRAQEAIYTDHGHGKPLSPEGYTHRSQQFRTLKLDLETQSTPHDDYLPKTGKRMQGGWTTERSHKGLIRRLLHAMNTNDEFVVVLGGDVVVAGHGNHFRQAYPMIFHRIFSPILARMGVKLITRNMAMGHGFGTMQSSLGFSSLYGRDIDVLIWDSAISEGQHVNHLELFLRQGLLSSGPQGKIPFLLIGPHSKSIPGMFELLRWLHNEAGVDVGQLGTAMKNVPVTTSAEQAATLPYPYQYLLCDEGGDVHALCNAKKHCTKCWIDREDVANPKDLFPNMDEAGGDAVSNSSNGPGAADTERRWWYPGWREHQLLGRSLTFFMLDALEDALNQWSAGTMGGPPLEDEEWHVTSFYDDMSTMIQKAFATSESGSACHELALPERFCTVPLKGATQYTPRPQGTSLTDLIVTGDASLIPTNPKKVQYEGQDIHNQCLDPGATAVDVVRVVSNRRLQESNESGRLGIEEFELDQMPPFVQEIHSERIRIAAQKMEQEQQRRFAYGRTLAELGSGWTIRAEKPGQCDGQYLSICGRDSDETCPLLGYHDSRGEIIGTEDNGWLVMNLPDVKEGIIMIKYTFYETPGTSSNRRQRNLRTTKRSLESAIPNGDSFSFDFALDGTETSWRKTDLLGKSKTVYINMALLTLMDNPNFASEPKPVQLAIRVRGCGGGSCLFGLSHVYWA